MKTKKIILNSFIISLLIFILIPLNLVAHNTAQFNGFSYSDFFWYGSIFTLLSGLVISFIFYILQFFSFKLVSKISTAIFGYLVICGFYFSIRSGLLDGTNVLKISYINLWLVIIITLLGTLFFEKKFKWLIFFGLIGGILTAIVGLNSLKTSSHQYVSNSGFLDVSSNQKNIFVISFDGLETHTVKTILDHDPDLKKEFEGFINFPNVTAVAPFTALSILSTKLGYLPNVQLDNEALALHYNKNFITSSLRDMGYKTSTYSSFTQEEPLQNASVYQFELAPPNVNFYQLAFENALARYVPFEFHEINILMKNAIKKVDQFSQKSEYYASLNKIIQSDQHNMSYIKTDFIHFDYFVNHIRPTHGQGTAHFQHYVFTHTPSTFDANCHYRMANTLPQNPTSNLEETTCGLKQFIMFLKKLKDIHAFDNSLIIFTSDHGHECEYNEANALGNFRVSHRWCLSRYMPLLMIKPFEAKGPLKDNDFQASLMDISKTICESVAPKANLCKKYQGVNLLHIQSKDTTMERIILIPRETANADAREYLDFQKINIGRTKSIPEYFGVYSSETYAFPIILFGQDLPSGIDANIILNARQALPHHHQQGFLTYGPYLNLPAGQYSIELVYKSSAPENTTVGFWDITTDNGQLILKKDDLPGTADHIKHLNIPFSAKHPIHHLEFRTFFEGTHDLWVDKIMINKR